MMTGSIVGVGVDQVGQKNVITTVQVPHHHLNLEGGKEDIINLINTTILNLGRHPWMTILKNQLFVLINKLLE